MVDFEKILSKAIETRTSDIHLLKGIKPVYRIKRKLITDEESEPLTSADLETAFTFFTSNNENCKKVFENEKKLDIDFEYGEERFRVNISKTRGEYTFTLRFIRNALPKFSELGLPDIVRRLAFLPQGLVLITGKSNSGKTTTLNTLVNEVNNQENKKILMLENPIEYVHKSHRALIVQKEVGKWKDCETYKDGIINALREDCDILIIGEIRDKNTLEAAIEAAESGHLVIGTMHTKSAAETLDRVLSLYDLSEQVQIKQLVSSVLKAVVTQKLMPGKKNNLVMVPEIMIVDDTIMGLMRKENFSKAQIEDMIQSRTERGNVSFINSLANLVLKNKIDIQIAYEQLDEKEIEFFNRLLNQLKDV